MHIAALDFFMTVSVARSSTFHLTKLANIVFFKRRLSSIKNVLTKTEFLDTKTPNKNGILVFIVNI